MEQVWKVALRQHLLEIAINKIITQVDVRMKKLLPTRVSLGFGNTDIHDTDSLHGQKCEVRSPVSMRPYPALLHVTREFHSVKLICRNLYAIFSHVKRAYTANQNGV